MTKSRRCLPQAFISSYAPRLRKYANSLLTPVPTALGQIPIRTTKRGTTIVSYVEDDLDEFDLEELGSPRRTFGGRAFRREDGSDQLQNEYPGDELTRPIEVQGIWREWMGKPRLQLTEKQLEIQSALPLTLIPVRIDLEIGSFRPEAALPMPHNAREFGIDDSHAAYKAATLTPPYRLKDMFLWNLHEALMTPDYFAKILVDDLDFPVDRKANLIGQIANQIRQQLEEYAGVALHPLFHYLPFLNSEGSSAKVTDSGLAVKGSPQLTLPSVTEREEVEERTEYKEDVTEVDEDIFSPDDSYLCIINLNINFSNLLYSDKFEWSLLHPPGFAEQFARQTCADLGLTGEWVSAITHAIYEAVLRLKKEACESGGLLTTNIYASTSGGSGSGGKYYGGSSGEAGWRYDREHFCEDWEPKIEVLTKEEMDKREGDRERQIRRLRRETARFSSTAAVLSGYGAAEFISGGPGCSGTVGHASETSGDGNLGRSERIKKRRRFPSLSVNSRDTLESGGQVNNGGGTNGNGYGGGIGNLAEWERQNWRCSHCWVWGSAVWAVRSGPNGPRSLCNNCGLLYERDKQLPPWSQNLFIGERPQGSGGMGAR